MPSSTETLQEENATAKARIAELEAALKREKAARATFEQRVAQLSIKIVERDEKIELLERHALEDPLTGLYNRRYLEMHARRFENANSSRCLCLSMIDVNYLKYVNDNLGHDEGDRFLKFFTEKLNALPGINKTVLRLGGDEFGIIHVVESKREAITYGRSTRKVLNKGYTFVSSTEEKIPCVAAVGFVIQILDGNFSFEDLLKKADITMYRNKAKIKACHK